MGGPNPMSVLLKKREDWDTEDMGKSARPEEKMSLYKPSEMKETTMLAP